MVEVIELADDDDDDDSSDNDDESPPMIRPDRPVSHHSAPRPSNVTSSSSSAAAAAAAFGRVDGGTSKEDAICIDDDDEDDEDSVPPPSAAVTTARVVFTSSVASVRATSTASIAGIKQSPSKNAIRNSSSSNSNNNNNSHQSSIQERQRRRASVPFAASAAARQERPPAAAAAAAASSRKRRPASLGAASSSSYQRSPVVTIDSDDEDTIDVDSPLEVLRRLHHRKRRSPTKSATKIMTAASKSKSKSSKSNSNNTSTATSSSSSGGPVTFYIDFSSDSEHDDEDDSEKDDDGKDDDNKGKNNETIISLLDDDVSDDDEDDVVPLEAFFSPSNKKMAAVLLANTTSPSSAAAAAASPAGQQPEGAKRSLYPQFAAREQPSAGKRKEPPTTTTTTIPPAAAAVASTRMNASQSSSTITAKRKDPPTTTFAAGSKAPSSSISSSSSPNDSGTTANRAAAALLPATRVVDSSVHDPPPAAEIASSATATKTTTSTTAAAAAAAAAIHQAPPDDDGDGDDDDDSSFESSSSSSRGSNRSNNNGTSSDESMASPPSLEEERSPLLSPDQSLPPEIANELLLMPPQDRPPLEDEEAFRSLLQQEEQEEESWVRALQESQGPTVNIPRAWNDMGRRLREWQITADGVDPNDDDEDETTQDPPHVASKIPTVASMIPKEDRNFQGGIDPKISKDQGNRDLTSMTFVPMLDHAYSDPATGLPGRTFTVVGSPDDIMYSFQLQVRTSSIPNAGNGVFLTFLGAQELKPSRAKLGLEAHDFRAVDRRNIMFGEELHAVHPDGFGMKVNLTGEHLKSRYNTLYPLRKLKAVVPDTRVYSKKGATRTVAVTFPDPDLPYGEDELEGLKNPSQRIGHFALHNREDYVDAPRRTFSSLHANCGYIDIGRYGPFRKEDRKLQLHLQAKSFLFGFEPKMWSFGVAETIYDRDQEVDITDDLTGEPHDIARRNIPMYVNEKGHNPSLKETIHAKEADERIIHYFLMIKKPMKKGDEIEVFVDYKDLYEGNRIRRGYGMDNMAGYVQGDDHFPSRLQRNHIDRHDFVLDIEGTGAMDLYLLVEFCHELAQNLHPLMNDFVRKAGDECNSSPLTSRQIGAVRRLDWLTTFLEEHSDRLKESAPPTGGDIKTFEEIVLPQCDVYISEIRWGRWSELLAILDKFPAMTDKNGNNLLKDLEQEGVEEVCFKASSEKLAMPLDGSRWCPIAVDLTYAICTATARTLWQNLDRAALAQTFLRFATEAATEIGNPLNCDRLAFDARFEDPFVSSNVEGSAIEKGKDRSKVVVTRPAIETVTETENEAKTSDHGAASETVTEPENEAKTTDHGAASSLKGKATPVEGSASYLDTIQKTWYLARQVMYVADALSGVALADEPTFSRKTLLEQVGIDSKVCEEALNAEILPLKEVATEKPKNRRKGRPKAEGGGSPKKRAVGPPKERCNKSLFWHIVWSTLKDDLGWTMDHGSRPNDFYALPPGVARGKGFRPRIDFFDSVPLVIEFIKTNLTWKENPAVVSCLQEYYACKDLYDKLRSSKKKFPKFESPKDMIEWLQKEVKATNNQ